MRLRSCLLPCLISPAAFGQDLPAKVTYTSPAAKLERELADIGKMANLSLLASPDLGAEIVLIKAKDLPLQTLMSKIATVTSGRWTRTSNGYLLVADTDMRRSEAIASRAARLKKIDESITKLYEPISNNPTLKPDSTGNKMSTTVSLGTGGMGMSMSDGSPAGRALIRLVKLMGAAPFADLETGDRAVWSTNPNRSQRALPGGSPGVIQTLVAEQRVFAAQAAKDKKDDSEMEGEAGESIKQMQSMLGIDPEAMTRPLQGPPAKVLLVASREGILGGIALSVVLYDSNGKVLLTSRQNLAIGGGFMDMEELAAITKPTGKPAPPKPADSREIRLSSLSKEMLAVRAVNGMNPGSLEAKIPDDLRALMLKPEERDPLSFAESEATLALADARGEAVVADLPDGLLQFTLGASTDKLTIGGFEEKLKKSATLTEADGILTVKPLDPYGARKVRVDRLALGQFVRAAVGKEFAALDDLAQYALKNPSPYETPAATTYLIHFSPDVLQSGVGGRADWDMLRLYATLGPDARANLARGGALRLGNLAPQQAGYASKLLFGSNAHLQFDDLSGKKSDTPDFLTAAMTMFRMPTDYRTEPTEAMPNGVPGDGVLTMSASQEPVAKSTSAGMMGMAALGLDELAMLKFFKESPQFAQMQQYMPNLNELRFGTRSVYHFKFLVAPQTSESQTLIDNRMPKDAQTVAMANLPDDVAKQLNARVEAFKKLPFFNPAMFGGGTPPP